MKIATNIIKLEPKNPFRIARGEKRFVDNVFLRVESEGIIGLGEASPNSYYNESADDVSNKLSGLKDFLLERDISSIQDIKKLWKHSWPLLKPSRAAQCALDIALWDLLGKKMGTSVSRLIWKGPPKKLTSSCTLGLCDPDEWEERVSEIVGFPVIKIKMDEKGDLDFVRFIRSRTDAAIRVDANCSWGKLDIPALIQKLREIGVEFVEQPLPPDQNDKMAAILKKSALPIIADESSVVPSDIKALKGKFSGINIKLVKCGGLTPGLEMLKKAKAMGFSVMVGCMLESNLLISAGAALGQKADYIDLDGSWLLKDALFKGLDFQSGIITLSDEKGLGVSCNVNMNFYHPV